MGLSLNIGSPFDEEALNLPGTLAPWQLSSSIPGPPALENGTEASHQGRGPPMRQRVSPEPI